MTITISGKEIRVADEIGARWVAGGMPTGMARNTAHNQSWLDRCPAVLVWTASIDDNGREFLEFAYDAAVEVLVVPDGVEF